LNIFEYLGLDAAHRAAKNKVTQFVKHWDEVVEMHKKDKAFAVQVKRDGVCALIVVKDKAVRIFSRTGKEFTNTHIIINRLEALGLEDGVYFGELLLPKVVASLEVLSGVVNPNRVKGLDSHMGHIPALLEMHFFDMVEVEEFILGKSDRAFSQRFDALQRRVGTCPANGYIFVLDYIMAFSEAQVDEILVKLVANGEEGIVIRDPYANWEAGHKGWRVMKKVRGVDYDLKCIGWEEGTGKYEGKVANLIFNWKDGKTIKAMLGKGWTHAHAAGMFLSIQHSTETFGDLESPIGKIFQVYALEESSKGKLRLPKVGEARFDKEVPDV